MVSSNLTDTTWGNPPWPNKFTELRPHQIVALERVLDAYRRGIDIVILDAPTGSGKSAIGEAVRRILEPRDSLYVCHTIGLQEQFCKDFPYARLLMGKSNYPTADRPDLFGGKLSLSAADCDMSRGSVCSQCEFIDQDEDEDSFHCTHCHGINACPYRIAKFSLLDESCPIGVTNTSYFLTEANYVTSLSNRDLVIMDEADTIHKILLGLIEVEISQYRAKKYDLNPPKLKTVESSWVEWLVKEAIPKFKDALNEHKISFFGRKPTVQESRETKYLTGMLAKLYLLPAELNAGNIVYDGYEQGDIKFKPIHVDTHAADLLWKHANRWLLMSASFVDPIGELLRLGADKAHLSWEVVTVPSTFDIKRRPIHVKPVADMSYKFKAESWPKMVKGIQDVVDNHADDRILIHTVSYEFMNYIDEKLNVNRDVLSYKSAKQRENTLAKFRKTDAGILLAPSMDRGISLDDDDCRVIIIPKMPRPNLGDKVVAKRLHSRGGQLWYCLAPNTPILTKDLRWIQIGDIQTGDEIIAFEEFPSNWCSKWKSAVVEGVSNLKQPCWKFYLEDGTELISSEKHQWLTIRNGKRVWETTLELTERLKKNQKANLLRITDTWKSDYGWDTGYLAGILDGEGHLSQSDAQYGSNRMQMGFAQKEGIVSELAVKILKENDFKVSKYSHVTLQFQIQGGRPELLRLLGQIRPPRLLQKFNPNIMGAMYTKNEVPIIHAEYVGKKSVVGLKTSENTLLANGFATHNSVETLRTLVQMTGRGMRSESDWCSSYILDQAFVKILQESRNLLPDWWLASLDMSGGVAVRVEND